MAATIKTGNNNQMLSEDAAQTAPQTNKKGLAGKKKWQHANLQKNHHE